MGVQAFALAACSADNGSALSEINSIEVAVHNASGAQTFGERIGFGGTSSLLIEGVPEGPDEDVTVLGFSGGANPSWFGRKRHVVVEKGRENPVDVVLSRFGGFSCPAGDNEYTHRIFPSVTALGGGLYFIAGGLTSVNQGGVTRFETSDSSRKAFVYDSSKGTLKRAASLMAAGRGAHTAQLIRGAEKNRVVLYGGTNALLYNANNANGFGWSYDTSDAHSTVEVYEWDAGGDPTAGVFVDFEGQAPQMYRKRVFPNSAVVSTDGLVLVCAGGPWGVTGDDRPDGYDECDVWDSLDNAFLPNSLSNSFMAQYRAGASVAAFQQGEVTKLLIVGGVTEGPIAEVYTSSSAQRDGVGGSFIAVDVPGPPHSFFQSLTAVGNNEFIMIGGVNWNGLHFDPPSPEHAWRLTVQDEGKTVNAEAIPGLAVGRYFHAAHAPKGRLVVLGGFTGTDLTPTSDIRFLQAGVGFVVAEDEAFSGRGAFGSTLLDNDTILLVGGIAGADDLKEDAAGAIEIYTPSNLFPF